MERPLALTPPPPPSWSGRLGVLAFKLQDEDVLLRTLVYELHPDIAASQPGLPAYILFMCLRYTDMLNKEKRTRSLLNNALKKIFYNVKKNSCNIEIVILWVSNVCRLLHTLKQYSGEEKYQTHNTEEQTSHSLQNFDLSEYRQLISDVAIRISRTAIRSMQHCLLPLIEEAVLIPAATLPTLPSTKINRRRSSVFVRELKGPLASPPKLDLLISRLNTYNDLMVKHGIDQELRTQMWNHIFWFVSAESIRTLIENPELCSWTIGARIRCNVHELEEWIRDHREDSVLVSLRPIIQVSQLLQTRKMLSDASTICSMVDQLTIAQVEAILRNYSPEGPLEERPSSALVNRVKERLFKKRQIDEKEFNLHIDGEQVLPLTVPYNPSTVRLNEVEIPEAFHLYMVHLF